MDLATAIERITFGPAQILGLPCGRLDAGRIADVCIFDQKARWVPSASTLVSQGRNTPFLGQEMTGRVRWTLLAGRIVFRREAPCQ
jgi:dihydroorotase